jgi:hypothetical protein
LWKFALKIAPVTLHFREILAMKNITLAQVFFFCTIIFLIKILHLHSKIVHFTTGRSNLTFSAPHLTAIISRKIVDFDRNYTAMHTHVRWSVHLSALLITRFT